MTKKRKKTELGRTLAKIRIDFDETGSDMAKRLGISSSQMFNIEVGLAQVGYEFIGKIKEVYSIDLAELMKRGGFMSKITLDLDELSAKDKETVLEIWATKWEGEQSESDSGSFTKAAGETTPTVAKTAVEKPRVVTDKPRVVTDKSTNRKRPRTNRANDGIDFLDEESELDGIDEATAL